MTQKKFRVQKADGTTVIIEANNIDDAISKARSQFGQLPNDINNKISISTIEKINSLIGELDYEKELLKKELKVMEWESYYKEAHSISAKLREYADTIDSLVGSMVKINKGENNEQI